MLDSIPPVTYSSPESTDTFERDLILLRIYTSYKYKNALKDEDIICMLRGGHQYLR